MNQLIQIIFVGILCITLSCSKEKLSAPINPEVIAHYPLDGNAYDIGSLHNHGRIIGKLLPILDLNKNKSCAIKFENNNGYIEVIQRPNIEFNNRISISLNLLITSKAETWKAIISKWNSLVDEIPRNKNCGFYLGIKPNTTIIRWNISGEYVDAISELEIDRWYRIVCTFNGSEADIYIDGKHDNTALIKNSLIDTYTPLTIGAQSNMVNEIYPNYFYGCLDEIVIYNYELKLN